MKFEWEELLNLRSCKTYRARVFGGWIVNNLTFHHATSISDPDLLSESMVFVPDINHEWTIDND